MLKTSNWEASPLPSSNRRIPISDIGSQSFSRINNKHATLALAGYAGEYACLPAWHMFDRLGTFLPWLVKETISVKALQNRDKMRMMETIHPITWGLTTLRRRLISRLRR